MRSSSWVTKAEDPQGPSEPSGGQREDDGGLQRAPILTAPETEVSPRPHPSTDLGIDEDEDEAVIDRHLMHQMRLPAPAAALAFNESAKQDLGPSLDLE